MVLNHKTYRQDPLEMGRETLKKNKGKFVPKKQANFLLLKEHVISKKGQFRNSALKPWKDL